MPTGWLRRQVTVVGDDGPQYIVRQPVHPKKKKQKKKKRAARHAGPNEDTIKGGFLRTFVACTGSSGNCRHGDDLQRVFSLFPS